MGAGSLRLQYRRRGLHLSVVAIAVLILSLSATRLTGGGEAKPDAVRLTILYTSLAEGQIRSCNCTKIIWGGYGRMATLVEQIREECPHAVLVEGGSMVRTSAGQDQLKAEVAMQAINAMGYAALTPGKPEIAFGLQALKDFVPEFKVPLALANVTYGSTGDFVADKAYVIRDVEGTRLAIIGLMGSEIVSRTLDTGLNVEVEDPLDVLERLAPEVRKKSDLILVVSHSGAEQARRLAESGFADIVLGAISPDRPPMPESPAKTIIEAPAEKIGDTLLVVSGTRMCWSLGRLDLQLDGLKIKNHTNRLYYLGREYKDHASIEPLYDEYNRNVRELAMERSAKIREMLEEAWKRRGMEPPSDVRVSPFAGSESCKECHQEAYEIWAKTRHAKAFASLKKTNQEFDPECVSCHVTGAHVRGGFTDAEATPELVNVHCEACHGPGLAHTKNPVREYGGLHEELCRSCHTDEFNPDFNYRELMDKIAH